MTTQLVDIMFFFLDGRKRAKALFKPAVSPPLCYLFHYRLGAFRRSFLITANAQYITLSAVVFSPRLNMNLLALHNKEGDIVRWLYNRSKTNSSLYVCAIVFACLGAMHYLPNISNLCSVPCSPHWLINLLMTLWWSLIKTAACMHYHIPPGGG